MHDTFFDIYFLETDQNEVGISRIKLPVHHNVKPVGVEPDRRGGVSEPPEGSILMAEGATQPSKGACEPSDALLLLAAHNSGKQQMRG